MVSIEGCDIFSLKKKNENWNRYFESVDLKISTLLQRKKLLSEGFVEGINELLKNGNKVIIIYPIPIVGWNVPKKLMNSLPKDDSQIKMQSLQRFIHRNTMPCTIL